jgi:hypothetical protein
MKLDMDGVAVVICVFLQYWESLLSSPTLQNSFSDSAPQNKKFVVTILSVYRPDSSRKAALNLRQTSASTAPAGVYPCDEQAGGMHG